MAANPRLFISYARRDGEAFATTLRQRLADELGADALWQDRARLEGGIDWWKQITAALDAVDFMVLVATPAALASGVVEKEWRYARQQGVCVYPVQVPGLPINFNAIPRWMRDKHFYNLDKEWETFVGYLKGDCRQERIPFMPPDLPKHFVERPSEFNAIKNKLIDAQGGAPLAITTALRGAGGFGKTTLAAALCHDADIGELFSDGVLWVTLGEQPKLVDALTKLYAALTDERPTFKDDEDAATQLGTRLGDKKCLLVIDDVWRAADAKVFMRGGAHCARLITTRLLDVAVDIDADWLDVEEMQPDQAAALLTSGLDAADRAAFAPLAKRLGYYPLMLELANGALRKHVARGKAIPDAVSEVIADLEEEGFTTFDRRTSESRNDSVARSLNMSLNMLEADEREQCLSLAIFAEDTPVPISALLRLWDVSERKARRLCEQFSDLSLVRLNAVTYKIQLHDVLRGVFVTRLPDVAGTHRRMIAAWGDPYTLPDAFAWTWYAYHLRGAGQADRLRALLLDYGWLRAKLSALDVDALLVDFAYAPPDDALRLVQSALSISQVALAADKSALGAQLRGRLLIHAAGQPALAPLLAGISEHDSRPAFVPLNTCLTPAGGALLRVLVGHTDEVNGALALPDGRFISWASGSLGQSKDTMLRLWGSDGTPLAVLQGHTGAVNGVIALTDGRFLSWSADKTLRLWTGDGNSFTILEGHTGWVNGALALADGRSLSWSADKTLRLWGSEGTPLAILEGHIGLVYGALALTDGRFLSWSADSTLRLWGEDGMPLALLEGHTDGVNRALGLMDGRFLSWSADSTLRLWGKDGTPLVVLAGHTGWVNGALALADGRFLSWSADKTLRLWTGDGMPLAILEGHTDGVNGALALTDGRFLSCSADKTLRLWNDEGISLTIFEGHMHSVRGTLALTDGRFLSWSADKMLRLWGGDGIPLTVPQNHMKALRSVLMLFGGNVLSWSLDSTLRLWGKDGTPLAILEGHTDKVNGALALADGRFLSWSRDKTLRLWDGDGTLLAILEGHTDKVNGALALADGRFLSWSADKTLRLWDGDGTLFNILEGHTNYVIGALELSDGQFLTWSADSTLRLWGGNGTPLVIFEGHTGTVKGALALSDGRFLSWSRDNTLRVWRADGAQITVFTEYRRGVHGALALSDERILSWSEDYSLRLWSGDGTPLAVLPHMSYVSGAMTLSDRRILSWSWDKTLRLWDENGTLLIVLRGHTRNVNDVMKLSDGRFLSRGDTTLRLWAGNGTLWRTFYADAPITACVWDETQHLVVAGDEQGRMYFLRLVD